MVSGPRELRGKEVLLKEDCFWNYCVGTVLSSATKRGGKRVFGISVINSSYPNWIRSRTLR